MIGKLYYLFFFLALYCNIDNKKFYLTAPFYLSPDTCAIVEDYFSGFDNNDISKIVQLLIKQFPWITNVKIYTTTEKKRHVTINIQTPLYSINNTHYLTTEGTFLPAHLLKKEVYESLPSIIYTPQSYSEIDDGQKMALLPRELFENYTIIWNSADFITLYDKKQECFPIITSYEKGIKPSLHNHCNYIYNKISQTPPTNKKKKLYTLDIRFDKQIVLRPQGEIKT